MNKRDFKSLIDINSQEFKRIIEQAINYKELDKKHSVPRTYVNRTLAMIFKKNSTRTRVSFETAMYKLGGHAIFLSESSTQLNRGEDISDTARVLSGMVDLIMMYMYREQYWEQNLPIMLNLQKLLKLLVIITL